MIRFIIGIFIIIILAAVIGLDTCACGCGPTVRKNIKSFFQQAGQAQTKATKFAGEIQAEWEKGRKK